MGVGVVIVLPKPQDSEGVCGYVMLNAESRKAPALPSFHVALAGVGFRLKVSPTRTSIVKFEMVCGRPTTLV